MKSMTGFGKSELNSEDYLINVEIKSVNHRYFEAHAKINKEFSFLEEKIKLFLKSKLKRGKVDIYISIKSLKQCDNEFIINESLAQNYFKAIKGISKKFKLPSKINAVDILNYEGVATLKPTKINEEEFWGFFEPVLSKACDKLIQMRLKEGENIKYDIQNRAKEVLKLVNNIETLSTGCVEAYKNKINNKLKEILSDDKFSQDRILMEAAILADKADISEEIVRLKSHLGQLFELIETDDSIGRKLDFLIQEMNRETNTIGSKSLDSKISIAVIDIKSEIEKIREQVQNVQWQVNLFMEFVNIGFNNYIAIEKIVTIVTPDAAPIKRLIQQAKQVGNLIDATNGRKTKSVIVTNSDCLVLSYLQPENILSKFISN